MISVVVATIIRLFTGVRMVDFELLHQDRKVFYSRHTSHFDFLTIWAALPLEHRTKLRPVAARDYWGKTPLRRWFSGHILNAILIDRKPARSNGHPLDPLLEAIDAGFSLLIFPEGTRVAKGVEKFKPGIFHLAQKRREILFIPVRLENLGRILPKGEFLPIPIIARLEIAEPIQIEPSESKDGFLKRASSALETHAL